MKIVMTPQGGGDFFDSHCILSASICPSVCPLHGWISQNGWC